MTTTENHAFSERGPLLRVVAHQVHYNLVRILQMQIC